MSLKPVFKQLLPKELQFSHNLFSCILFYSISKPCKQLRHISPRHVPTLAGVLVCSEVSVKGCLLVHKQCPCHFALQRRDRPTRLSKSICHLQTLFKRPPSLLLTEHYQLPVHSAGAPLSLVSLFTARVSWRGCFLRKHLRAVIHG